VENASVTAASPTVADVERITAVGDPVLRNLQITQCYCELSREFAARTGGAPANWCSFATWASKQAGQTIRKEDLRRAFERVFTRSPDAESVGNAAVEALADLSARRGRDRVWDALWPALLPDCAFERASDAVARGNRRVFEEIGREFARFLALPATELETFPEGLRPGDPPDGQSYLRQAFTAYTAAFHEEDLRARAQLILLANLAIGWHEQTRLQPEISEALDSAFEEPVKLRRGLLRHLLRPRLGLALRLLADLLPGRQTRVKKVLDELDRHSKQIAHEVITDLLMTLSLPGQVLRLARDVPGTFPPELTTIDNADLRTLLATIDRTPDTPRGSGAESWSSLPDRINYIADLFRVYQHDPKVLSDAFTEEQVAVIKRGGRPDGRL
jgi:hypothetical protein